MYTSLQHVVAISHPSPKGFQVSVLLITILYYWNELKARTDGGFANQYNTIGSTVNLMGTDLNHR